MSRKIDRLAEEPFRVFFPLGILASVIGVALWPLHFAGGLSSWPLEAHARFMVVGFGGCFICGFLGTAGPRLLGSFPWSRFEVVLHALLALAIMGTLAAGRIAFADGLCGFWFTGILVSSLMRVLVGRTDVPPPGFPIAAIGILGAALSGFALALDSVVTLSPAWRTFWRLLLFQGLLWLPVIGVAPYLLPRFFGKSSPHAFDESDGVPEGWWGPFVRSALAGALVIASFIMEARGLASWGMALRAVTVAGALLGGVPGLATWSRTNALGFGLRWVAPCAATGWLLAVWLPPLRMGLLHVMFIGAAGLLMVAVATRIVLGHGNRHDRLGGPMKWFHAVWILVLLVAGTRIVPEFVPKIRVSHFIYAAVFWVISIAFWAWKLRKELRAPRLETELSGKRCPRRAGNRHDRSHSRLPQWFGR